MSELDLQALWQGQRVDREVVEPERRGPAPLVDFAVPTARFSRPGQAPRGSVAVVALVALAAVTVLAVWWPNRDPLPAAPVAVAPSVEPAEELEARLAECRTYSDPQAPDWARAEAACEQVLELEPIHHEALAIVRRIKALRACQDHLDTAQVLLEGGRTEEALTSLAKVTNDCESYFLRALTVSRPALAVVKKQAGAECGAYAKAKQWEVALPRCDLYARLACQSATLSRQSDPLFANLLDARQKRQPDAPPWQCPLIEAFRPPPAPPDPSALARAELARRYPEPELGRALVLYFEGQFQSAPIPLQKVSENMGKAQHHQAARALLLDLNEAINLYENGTTELTNGRLERAEGLFLRALAVDERLVLGERLGTLSAEEKRRELTRRESFLRKTILAAMTRESYERGKMFADRKDFRAACRMWKLGFSFSRSDLDLLKALTNVCTRRAADALDQAQTCEQLRAASDFAVDGDGYRERIEAQRAARQCP